jgi:hypothetical protein
MIRPLDALRIALAIVALLPAGCMDRDLTGMDPVVQSVTLLEVAQPPSGKVDILVVVDNSGSMAEEQGALALNFPGLIQELMNPTDPEHNPVTDLNVGVVSTDLGSPGYRLQTCDRGRLGFEGGDDGCLLSSSSLAGCSGPYPSFLHRGPDNEASFPLDQMGTDFACMATLGTHGCGFEQQMKAARRALVDQTKPGGCNPGFLRPDSILAVLWVTDEEDCSVGDPRIMDESDAALALYGHPNIRCYIHQEMLESVAAMIDDLRMQRSNARDFVLAMIVGVPVASVCEGLGNDIGSCLTLPEMQYQIAGNQILPSACLNPPGCVGTDCRTAAVPGRRFMEAAQMLGSQALVHSICNDDWRPAMNGILDLIQGALTQVCFPHELALDATTCQADCKIVETLVDDGPCPAGRTAADPPTSTDQSGNVHRRCVIAQAARTPLPDGTCPTTASSGWYYVPAAQSAAGCDQVLFADDAVPTPMSTTQLECLSYVCPAERRCGGASNPGGRCCAEDQTCVDIDPLAGGRCASL